MKNVKKLFIIFLLIIGIIISAFCSSFAGGVPKYNPKDPNPKPGLYRVEDINYRRAENVYINLENGKVLIYGYAKTSGGKHFKTPEIFDSNKGKFYPISDMPYVPFSTIQLDDGRYLVLGSSSPYAPRDKCLEIYDPNINKFIDTKVCIDDDNYCAGDASIFKLKNNNIALYKSRRLPLDKKKSEPKPFKPFKRGSTSVYDMYLYDINNNKLSDKPIKKGEKGYVDKDILIKELREKDPEYCFMGSNEFTMMRKVVNDLLGANTYTYIKLDNNKVLIIARKLVDYGVPIDSIENGKYKNSKSWYSPLYEYNLKDKTLHPLNEYIGAVAPFTINIKERNMLLIYGTLIPWYGEKYINKSPKDVPYKERIHRVSANIGSRHAYVYIY